LRVKVRLFGYRLSGAPVSASDIHLVDGTPGKYHNKRGQVAHFFNYIIIYHGMNQFISLAFLIGDLFIAAVMLLGTIDSVEEHETRPAILMALGFLGHMAWIPVILYMPVYERLVLGYFGVMGLALLVFLIPATPKQGRAPREPRLHQGQGQQG
jgi:hypothetical protein